MTHAKYLDDSGVPYDTLVLSNSFAPAWSDSESD